MAEIEYASKGIAGTGLGLGIAGTALGLMSGGFNNLWGNNYNNMYNGACSDNCLVNRYELNQTEKISRLETEVALRDANIFTDKKISDVFERLNTRLIAMDKENCQYRAEQGIVNSKLENGITLLGSQVASVTKTIDDLTKVIIPNSSVCPGFGDVKVCVVPCESVVKK